MYSGLDFASPETQNLRPKACFSVAFRGTSPLDR